MKRIRLLYLVLFASVQFLSSQSQLLVSTAWVDEHKNDPNVVLLQLSGLRKDFLNGHIPGARFLWWQHLSPSNPDESTALPALEQAKSTLEELGVSNASRVILYGGPNVVTVLTRTYLMFEYLGLAENVSIMNGGMDVWKSEKRAISTEPSPTFQRGRVSLKANPNVIVDVDWVKSNLKNPSVTIVDARGKQAYDGTPGSPQRSGHIPGAKLAPLSNNFVDSLNRFKSPDSLRKYFTDAGINPASKIVPYCWVGQMATVPYFAAKLSGYDVAFFDGSWEIWAMDESDPVEQTPPPPKVEKK